MCIFISLDALYFQLIYCCCLLMRWLKPYSHSLNCMLVLWALYCTRVSNYFIIISVRLAFIMEIMVYREITTHIYISMVSCLDYLICMYMWIINFPYLCVWIYHLIHFFWSLERKSLAVRLVECVKLYG